MSGWGSDGGIMVLGYHGCETDRVGLMGFGSTFGTVVQDEGFGCGRGLVPSWMGKVGREEDT